MPKLFRFALLLGAGLCGGFVAFIGAAFSFGFELENYQASFAMFWLFVGAVFSAPLWIPALIPSGFTLTLKICRWVGAFLLLGPTWLFGGIVWGKVDRGIFVMGGFPLTFVLGMALTLVCLACFVLLMWPELRSMARRLS